MSIEQDAKDLLAKAVQTLEADVEKLIHPAQQAAQAAAAEVKAEVKKEDTEVRKEVAAVVALPAKVEDKVEADVQKQVAEVKRIVSKIHPLAPDYLDAGMTIAYKEVKKL